MLLDDDDDYGEMMMMTMKIIKIIITIIIITDRDNTLLVWHGFHLNIHPINSMSKNFNLMWEKRESSVDSMQETVRTFRIWVDFRVNSFNCMVCKHGSPEYFKLLVMSLGYLWE